MPLNKETKPNQTKPKHRYSQLSAKKVPYMHLYTGGGCTATVIVIENGYSELGSNP